MLIKKEIMQQLSMQLSLPYTGKEQDWDLEMANSNRIEEFIKFYKEANLSDEKKVAIMSLILASYDDLLNKKNLKCDEKWNAIKFELTSQKKIFKTLIDYWSLVNEIDKNNVFVITPLIREVKATK